MIVPYTPPPGSPSIRELLRRARWRFIVSGPKWIDLIDGFPYAIDNGAWIAHVAGKEWNEDAFLETVERIGEGADFIVVPDIVEGGLESLERTKAWLPRLASYPTLIAVQDGIEPEHVDGLLGDRVGIFLGGSTDYKLDTMFVWGEVCKRAGCHYHIGRVNSKSRVLRCMAAGAHSFDGSGVTRWPYHLPEIETARRQTLFDFDD